MKKLVQELYYWIYKGTRFISSKTTTTYLAILWLTLINLPLFLSFIVIISYYCGIYFNAIYGQAQALLPILPTLSDSGQCVFTVSLSVVALYYFYYYILRNKGFDAIEERCEKFSDKRQKRGKIYSWIYLIVVFLGGLTLLAFAMILFLLGSRP